MLNSMQGVDAIFGGFAAGMDSIRARNQERANISYFARRCREMEEWGQEGWEKFTELRKENARLRQENAALTRKAAQAAGNLAMSKDVLNWLRDDLSFMRKEMTRLKSGN